MAEGREALRVFISYARRDATVFADELLQGMEVAGFDAFLDRHDIAAGEDWEARLGGLIQSADTVVFVITPAAIASERCAWEVRKAEELSKRIIPVVAIKVPDAETPFGLKRLNYIYFSEGQSFTRALGELAKALRVDLDWIREHTRLGELARRWQARDQNHALLLRGAELEGARTWLSGWQDGAPEPTDLHRHFINASETAEGAGLKEERERLQRQTRLQQLALYATVAALAITLIGAAVVVNLRQTLTQQTSLVLAGLGQTQYRAGDFGRGLRFSLLAARGEFLSAPVPEAGDALAANIANTPLLAEMRGHEGGIRTTLVSVDESRILTAGEDGTARLWDGQGALIAVLNQGEDDSIQTQRFLSDNGAVLTVGDMGARIWEPDGTERAVLAHEGDDLLAIATEDGRRVLTYTRTDGVARVWDAATGRLLTTVQGGPLARAYLFADGRVLTDGQDVQRVWSADGQLLSTFENSWRVVGVSASLGVAVVSDSLTMREQIGGTTRSVGLHLLNLETGAATPLVFPDNETQQLAVRRSPRPVFTPDQRNFILYWSGGVGIWDAETGQQVWSAPSRVRFSVPSRDGAKLFVVLSGQESAIIFNAVTGAQITPVPEPATITQASFDGDRLMIRRSDRRLQVFDIPSAEITFEVEHNDAQLPMLLADQRHVLTWAPNGEMRIWDAAEQTEIGSALTLGANIGGVRLLDKGKRILTFGDDGVARIFDAQVNARTALALRHEQGYEVYGARFLANETRILSWADGGARLSNAETGAPIGAPMAQNVSLIDAVVSPDERRILTWSGDGALSLWDANNGAPIDSVENAEPLDGALYSPDGGAILSWTGGGQAWVRDATSLAVRGAPMLHPDIRGALFSPNGDKVVTWGADGTARLWNASTGALIGAAMEHEEPVRGALFSPDGARVLTWSEDETARMWRASDGRPLGEPMRHRNAVLGGLFSEDGSRVLTWSNDAADRRSSLQWWSVETGAPAGDPMTRHEPVGIEGVQLSNGLVLNWGDTGARVWNAETGETMGSEIRHDSIAGATLSADASRLVTYGNDGFARVWNTRTGAEVGPTIRWLGSEWFRGAVFTRDESKLLAWGDEGGVGVWNIPWTRARPIATLWREVCDATPASIRVIDARDIEIAPILRGREGEDVCH